MDWQNILDLVAPVVLVASVVASGLNAVIRSLQDHDVKVPKLILWISAAINFVAVNADKAVQQLKGGRGPAAPAA